MVQGREFALDGGEELRVDADQVLEQAHEIMLMAMTDVIKRSAEAKSVVLASGITNPADVSKVDALSRHIVVQQEGLDDVASDVTGRYEPLNNICEVVLMAICPIATGNDNTGLRTRSGNSQKKTGAEGTQTLSGRK